jgi:histone H1/5
MAAKKPAKKTVKKTVVKLWTKAELSTLKKEYPKSDTQKLAKKLKRTLEAVRFQAKKHGLKKTKTYMQSLYKAASKPAKKKVVAKKKPAAKKKVVAKKKPAAKKKVAAKKKPAAKKVVKKATKKRAACKKKR